MCVFLNGFMNNDFCVERWIRTPNALDQLPPLIQTERHGNNDILSMRVQVR